MLMERVIYRYMHISNINYKKSGSSCLYGCNKTCVVKFYMFRLLLDTYVTYLIFLNSELFLPKGVSFVVSKYKFPPCVSQVIKLHANTIRLQLNVGPVSYQIKDI